ncbi:TPA: hypothetical protein U1D13_002076 [Streptococcus suis]|nr:hypothetical protein [Streptococcus suis]HEM3627441.1 hypothetical protein [Streptococcus suis]HEM3640498.1 hypothetical protein [Streptococcus suis]HEM3653577.1 hypothetical protein [Streptococcus suis]HEM3657983.1 hypothetical protein [Streptococcus suis]
MKSIYLLILKRRWFLFFILMCLSAMTNLVFWNESTQLIREQTKLSRMLEEGRKGSYEFYYVSETNESSQAEFLNKEDIQTLLELINEHLCDNPTLYVNRQNYMSNGQALESISLESLQKNVLAGQVYDLVLYDVVFGADSKNKLLATEVNKLGINIGIRPIMDTYKEVKSYYVENLYFAVIFSSITILFSSFIFYLLSQALVKICSQEIRTFRVIGATKTQLQKWILALFSMPILLGLLPVLLIIYLLGVGIIPGDVATFTLLNGMTILVCNFILRFQMREVLYD